MTRGTLDKALLQAAQYLETHPTILAERNPFSEEPLRSVYETLSQHVTLFSEGSLTHTPFQFFLERAKDDTGWAWYAHAIGHGTLTIPEAYGRGQMRLTLRSTYPLTRDAQLALEEAYLIVTGQSILRPGVRFTSYDRKKGFLEDLLSGGSYVIHEENPLQPVFAYQRILPPNAEEVVREFERLAGALTLLFTDARESTRIPFKFIPTYQAYGRA